LLGSLGAGLILYFLVTHRGHVSLPPLNIWLVVLAVQVFARVALVFRYKHVKPPPALISAVAAATMGAAA